MLEYPTTNTRWSNVRWKRFAMVAVTRVFFLRYTTSRSVVKCWTKWLFCFSLGPTHMPISSLYVVPGNFSLSTTVWKLCTQILPSCSRYLLFRKYVHVYIYIYTFANQGARVSHSQRYLSSSETLRFIVPRQWMVHSEQQVSCRMNKTVTIKMSYRYSENGPLLS